MLYSSAISPAVLGEVKKKAKPDPHKVLPRLHECERCKSYDHINLKQHYEWLKPFDGYVSTPLCWVCISELRWKK